MCGENDDYEELKAEYGGSPPRVRGKQNILPAMIISARITPACAGKTSHRVIMRKLSKDHPRVCGENTFFFEDLKRS